MITLEFRTSAFQQGFGRLQWVGNIPKAGREAIREYGFTLEHDIKASGRQARIKNFRGNLLGPGTRYEQAPNGNVGRLYMPAYGEALDSMMPHVVRVDRGRSALLAWAVKAGFPQADAVRAGRRKKFYLFVTPHPFIMRGYKRARSKFPAILRKHLAKARQAR